VPVRNITGKEVFMKALEKEIAGMLLNDSQTTRAMEGVINCMDEVFTNLSSQIENDKPNIIWFYFLESLLTLIRGKIIDSCLTDNQDVYESQKEIIDLFIYLDNALQANTEDMIID
jgi:hypothetical protein